MALSLVLEAGEVMEHFQWKNKEEIEKYVVEAKSEIGEELADVLFVTLCLANQTGVDLQAAFDKKMKVKTERDFDRHQNNEKLK